MKELGDPRPTLRRRIGALGLAVIVTGFLTAIVYGTPAHANPRPGEQTCTPPTNPYSSSATIANCGSTTTTSAPANVTLTVSYNAGHVRWKACAGASAQGSTAQLYIDGSQEDAAQVQGSGCTPDNNLALCLSPGTYKATVVDQPYGEASQSFTVNQSGCNNPIVLAGSAAATGNGGSNSSTRPNGSLAFTGSDVALMVIGAAILIAVGLYTIRMANQRRHAA